MRLPRVGLVLGAGGVLGGAWLVGGLHALRRELGWEPARAEHLVGTSAGALMAGLLAGGIKSEDLLPEAAREVHDTAELDPDGDWLLLELAAEASYQLGRRVPWPIPGSFGLCWAGLRRPGFWTPIRLLSGLAPAGLVSTEPIKRVIRRVHADGGAWPDSPACWIVARDYVSGRRVTFGRPGSPEAGLAEAVAASCAIPGFFQPERVDGRHYIDGGIGSLSNLDLLAGRGLDLVICLSPMSAPRPPAGWSPVDQVARAVGRAAAWQLHHEAERVRREGTPVILLEPGAEDVALMGTNLMEAKRALEVAQLASETVAAQLRDLITDGGIPAAAVREAGRLQAAA